MKRQRILIAGLRRGGRIMNATTLLPIQNDEWFAPQVLDAASEERVRRR